MKKQLLRFNVPHALEKVAKLYDQAQTQKETLNKYGEHPEQLCGALSLSPRKKLVLPLGYQKIAKALDTLDAEKWHRSFQTDKEEKHIPAQAYKVLCESLEGVSVCEHVAANQASDIKVWADNNTTVSFSISVSVTISITITATVSYAYAYSYSFSSGFHTQFCCMANSY